MEVGKIDLSHRLLLAPMAEVTDSSFRKIAKQFGAGLTFTQMVSAKGVIENQFETLRYLAFNKDEKPIGVQILGSDPQLISASVKEIIKYQPDIIDLNCGCPKPKVTKHHMGSCLMETPQLVGEIIKRMYKAAEGVPISAKFRLGYDRTKINILDNAKAAEDNGASLITVHARARVDKYDTLPEWDWLRKVKEAVSIPVVGNGSVFSADDAIQMINETGVDTAMVARGALGNPFIFERFNSIREKNFDPGLPGVEIVRDTVLAHIKLIEKEYGNIRGLDYIKKNVIWYFKYFNGIYELISSVKGQNSIQAIEELIYKHTDKILYKEYAEENIQETKEKFKMKVLFWLVSDRIYSENLG